ncbi:hypothetical protein Hsar01_02214 [Haloferula sargassicola]|uniref:PDZ domain-containing protein n=2 Tax=Haloferula sargassicola TaxID=490096 RepID=A0ABP9UT34_9BACT
MKKSGILYAGVFSLLSCALWGATEPVNSLQDVRNLEQKTEAVAAKVLPSVVALISDEIGASGSGTIVNEDGLILTAAHVTQGSEVVRVVFPNGRETRAEVLGSNFSKDIGMAKITDPGPWPHVEIGESKPLQAGDWVIAMGHSEGYDPSRPPPVRFGRVVSDGPGNFMTTDCTLIGGDSGGPLFDLDGKLVAVNSSIGQAWSNNNHAGVDGFQEDWDRLLAGEAWGELQLDPMINEERPVLGIDIAGQTRDGAVVVGAVTAAGPAQKAGIRAGDEIVSFEGTRIRGGRGLVNLIMKKEGGDTVKVGVRRGRETFEVEATLTRLDKIQDYQR